MRRIDSIQSGRASTFRVVAIRAGLWCVAQPYGVAVELRNWLYDRGWFRIHTAKAPVISVGNLTAGGTGKTPAVAYLARWFRERDLRVAILSRGYAALQDGANDEAKELEALLPDVPHLQSANRSESAEIACSELEMQLLLLDDGFQHRRLHRDLDIVLIDATVPFGHNHLLPRGLLREPIRSLRRADIVIATRADQVEPQELADIRNRVQRYNPRAAWIEAVHAPCELFQVPDQSKSVESVRGKNVVLISGIGNPQGFERTIKALGANVLHHFVFPDHHAYSLGDLKQIELALGSEYGQCDCVITTGKDLSKIETPQLGKWPLYALRVEFKIQTGQEILDEHLVRMVQRIELAAGDFPTG